MAYGMVVTLCQKGLHELQLLWLQNRTLIHKHSRRIHRVDIMCIFAIVWDAGKRPNILCVCIPWSDSDTSFRYMAQRRDTNMHRMNRTPKTGGSIKRRLAKFNCNVYDKYDMKSHNRLLGCGSLQSANGLHKKGSVRDPSSRTEPIYSGRASVALYGPTSSEIYTSL